jgi:type IX secretion system PorP/SprF family membrane protein
MKKLILVVMCIGSIWTCCAQQIPMFTHYMFNTLAINPAYAGTRDALTITGLHRKQWVAFDGAPLTQTLTVHTPAMNNKIGLGLSVVNDVIGPLRQTAVHGDYAYRLQINKKVRLSLGLKAGINVFQANLNDLATVQDNDPAFASNVQSRILPNFGFGAYYYSDKWYVGVSAPKLFENNFEADNGKSSITRTEREERHYFAIAGWIMDLSKEWKFRPTTFIKVVESAPLTADLSAFFVYREKIELGGMFRTGDAVGLLLGIYITPQLRFGYSYDWSYINSTMIYNKGSHEIMLCYDFIYKDKAKVHSPRYF